MRHIMSRADYNRLVVMVGVPLDTPGYDALRARIFEKEYPKTTGAVVNELRTRGLDVDINSLSYLMRKGKIPGIETDTGRYAAWHPEQIDVAAAWLAEAGSLTGSAGLCKLFDIDFGQDYEARENAKIKYPDDPITIVIRTGDPSKIFYVPEHHVKIKGEKA